MSDSSLEWGYVVPESERLPKVRIFLKDGMKAELRQVGKNNYVLYIEEDEICSQFINGVRVIDCISSGEGNGIIGVVDDCIFKLCKFLEDDENLWMMPDKHLLSFAGLSPFSIPTKYIKVILGDNNQKLWPEGG